MLTYPIRVQRRSYRGSNDPVRQAEIAELNRVAGILEDYINKQIEERKEEHQKYAYSKIAADLGVRLNWSGVYYFHSLMATSILLSISSGLSPVIPARNSPPFARLPLCGTFDMSRSSSLPSLLAPSKSSRLTTQGSSPESMRGAMPPQLNR